jgi:hypothetical protein
MAEPYNPIVRTFCQFRASVLSCIDIDRQAIRPGTPLESLLPAPSRRAVWDHLRRQGLRVPPLEFSERDMRRMAWTVLGGTVKAAAILRSWSGLLVAVPLAIAVYRANRRRAVQLSRDVKNVGELVIYMTRFADHKDSGYRWTRNEIELKVRFILAEQLGLDVDDVRPECTFAELGVD